MKKAQRTIAITFLILGSLISVGCRASVDVGNNSHSERVEYAMASCLETSCTL